ncbi:MAG: hypothetical protein HYU51_03150 [Candidatus Rokubacteria bacterium]|nr:hypothetical protein [Candidatus Rokubacteria bacterium]
MTSRTMTLRDRITALLRTRTGEEFCAACIAKMLDVRHKSAHQAALKLEASVAFRRQYGRCSTCGKTRLVATALGPTAAPPD